MWIELGDGEVRELIALLERRLEGLLREIAHTDDGNQRVRLRARYERLDDLRGRLATPVAPAGTHA